MQRAASSSLPWELFPQAVDATWEWATARPTTSAFGSAATWRARRLWRFALPTKTMGLREIVTAGPCSFVLAVHLVTKQGLRGARVSVFSLGALAGGEMNNGVISSLGKHVLESGGGVVEAEKPCMPRGADPDRMPIVPSQSKPPGLQARSCSGDGFDPSSFAAPPDSERGERGRERQHKMQFALAAQAAAAVDRSEEHFPEVVRAN
eukprot:TRINITY_DN14807_c0_g2_i3.p1 TRINITY_DN14807_c0_g2~~TRINITY_DN14807_c0_g2_i3.p1  ORF type:complete len:207 (-),score=30.48 TRINITY_DN14807_c0_g2_i3:175-795(-)